MSYVYFIGSAEIEQPLVKIGFTRGHPHARRDALQTGSPHLMDVIIWAPGTQADERRLHDRFAAFRKSGEWFHLEGFLQAYVADLVMTAPDFLPAPTLWTELYLSEPGA